MKKKKSSVSERHRPIFAAHHPLQAALTRAGAAELSPRREKK